MVPEKADSEDIRPYWKGIAMTAMKKKKASLLREGIDYLRFTSDFGVIPRGTVITNKRVIFGYPHIPRIFTLEKGIERNIPKDAELYIEEKIDGFNVRVASAGGNIYAFSRGGYHDSFSTEKAREAGFSKFFTDYPSHVLCGEMIGNTPYTPPTEKYDVRFYIFDIMDGKGRFVTCEEKYRLARRYSLESVPLLKRCKSSDMRAVKELAVSINRSGKEGMVIKTSDRKKVVKYVTALSDIADIRQTSSAFFDMPIGFFYQRILRSCMFVKDFELDREEYATRLGRAFYQGMMESLKRIDKHESIAGEFEINVKDAGIMDDIRKHTGRDVEIQEVFRRPEKEGRTRIRFLKVYRKTNRVMKHLAEGKGVID